MRRVCWACRDENLLKGEIVKSYYIDNDDESFFCEDCGKKETETETFVVKDKGELKVLLYEISPTYGDTSFKDIFGKFKKYFTEEDWFDTLKDIIREDTIGHYYVNLMPPAMVEELTSKRGWKLSDGELVKKREKIAVEKFPSGNRSGQLTQPGSSSQGHNGCWNCDNPDKPRNCVKADGAPGCFNWYPLIIPAMGPSIQNPVEDRTPSEAEALKNFLSKKSRAND